MDAPDAGWSGLRPGQATPVAALPVGSGATGDLKLADFPSHSANSCPDEMTKWGFFSYHPGDENITN